MALSEEQKEIKKKYAGYKRKVIEVAGEMHDIVEDTIWSEYTRLPQLSEKIILLMEDVNKFKSEHEFLK